MKYRMLTDEELKFFSEDLTHFLIVNGVHAEEWERMNAENPEQAIALVEVFSDTVLQKVYERLEYLEFRSVNSCMVFQCGKQEMTLLSLTLRPGSTADLSTPASIHEALLKYSDELQFFRSTKTYSATRELEIHRMLEQGCVLSSKEFWDALQHALAD